MKKKTLLLIILTSLFITNSSYAGTINGHFTCGDVIKYDKDNNLYARESLISWFDGFFSGVNWESNYTLKVPDSNSVYYSIVKYCKENPMKHSAHASVYIYQNLKN